MSKMDSNLLSSLIMNSYFLSSLIYVFTDLNEFERENGLPETPFLGWGSTEHLQILRNYPNRFVEGFLQKENNTRIYNTKYWEERARLMLQRHNQVEGIGTDDFPLPVNAKQWSDISRIHTCSDEEFIFVQLEFSQ